MIRKQFFIDEEQNRRLKSAALRSGRSEADIIREGIDEALAKEATANEDWKAALLSLAGVWTDYPEIDQVMADRRRRRKARRERMMRQMQGK